MVQSLYEHNPWRTSLRSTLSNRKEQLREPVGDDGVMTEGRRLTPPLSVASKFETSVNVGFVNRGKECHDGWQKLSRRASLFRKGCRILEVKTGQNEDVR